MNKEVQGLGRRAYYKRSRAQGSAATDSQIRKKGLFTMEVLLIAVVDQGKGRKKRGRRIECVWRRLNDREQLEKRRPKEGRAGWG